MEINDFPVFKTKIPGLDQAYNLNDPDDRRAYFDAKAPEEIAKLREYLKDKTFVAFLLGKKNAGKGTYSKLFMEAVGKDHVGHIAVGDLVRDAHQIFETGDGRDELTEFLKKNYRGFHTVEEIQDIVLGKSQDKLLSSDLILALMKYEISKRPRQALFIDGFPRAFDQIGLSLYLKEMVGYRNDPDVLVFLNVPNTIIDERIKYRVVCPTCKSPRGTKLLATKEAGWDEQKQEFYLKCDNPQCPDQGIRMIAKEGDSLGIEPIRDRIEIDNQIFNQLLKLEGIPKIYLRNSVPVTEAGESVDDYELTPEYYYELQPDKSVKILEKHWTIKDDVGAESYSLLPAAVVVSLIKQLAKTLGL